MTEKAVLRAEGLSKRFGGTEALKQVDIELLPGVVHGLVGPNGAGKSTLVGVLSGRVRADSGTVWLNDHPVRFDNPRDALKAGVITVPQELAVPADLTVSEVVSLGKEPQKAGIILRSRERRAVQNALDRLACHVSLDAPMGELSPSLQKSVIVAQALYRGAKVLFFDELTAGMTSEDAAHALSIIDSLCREGIAMLYISHRFDEVERLCERVTVLRDGAKVEELTGDRIIRKVLVSSILGTAGEGAGHNEDVSRAKERDYTFADSDIPVRLTADKLTTSRLAAISFAVREGEIIGFAGLPGSGVEDVFQLLSGSRLPQSGSVRIGKRSFHSVGTALRAGIAFLPGDRGSAVLESSTIAENMILSSLASCAAYGFLNRKRAMRYARPAGQSVGIEAGRLAKTMNQLSGGNQQRALIGRLLLTGAQVLVFENPTVGVDVHARAALHSILRGLAAEGKSCVIGSGEPEELAELCDRVLVLRRGTIAAELTGKELSAHAIMSEMG